MGNQDELAEEQDYFDRAAKVREQRIADASDWEQAAADRRAAEVLRDKGIDLRRSLSGPETAVAFGRIDLAGDERYYIGLGLIRELGQDPLVVNWQAPVAAPFYTASPADPRSVELKRSFECTGNHIDSYRDVVFAASSTVDGGPDPVLLGELARERTGRLRDIVRTIQAEQYALIQAPLEQILVIEGGPGTGKTVVALHRVSWLLYNLRQRIKGDDVLVVGPNPTFTRYIESVLPGLGDDLVLQVDIARLAPQVKRGRKEPAEVDRVKGEARMAGLLARALQNRIGRSEPAERLQVDTRFISLPGAEVDRAIRLSIDAGGSYLTGRQGLRDRLHQLVLDRSSRAPVSTVDTLLDRLWPQLTAPLFLRDLLASRERLLAAGGADFTEAELLSLRRRGSDRLSEEVWSTGDLPLLDEAQHLIEGLSARRFQHIVVDEAQDLSPMQLRSIARRSLNGSLTLVGDLAQSTGEWARDDWADILAHLPGEQPAAVQTLHYGYRVPSQVFDFLSPLLAAAVPTSAPLAVRQGPADPRVHRVDPASRVGRAVIVAMEHAAARRFVGIVCPADLRSDLEDALIANGASWSSADRGELAMSINVVSPQEAKGLEFDAVVVLEPESIVAADPRGLRLLYVAMTRTVGYLDVVCTGDPLPLSAPLPPTTSDPAISRVVGRQIDKSLLAQQIAMRIRASVADQADWPAVLREITRHLNT